MARNYLNFGGQIATPFTVLAEFQRNISGGFFFVFETYRSTADFNADGARTDRLTLRVDPATGFAGANAALLVTLRDLMLNEMGLGGRGFTFTEFQWFPLNKVLTCSAVKAEQNSVFTKRGADYDAFVTANQATFNNLNAAAWTHAKANDVFLGSMTAAV
jgi:hypothetical protein